MASYTQSLEDVKKIFEPMHENSEFMMDIDLQDSLGPCNPIQFVSQVGPQVEGAKGVMGKGCACLVYPMYGAFYNKHALSSTKQCTYTLGCSLPPVILLCRWTSYWLRSDWLAEARLRL